MLIIKEHDDAGYCTAELSGNVYTIFAIDNIAAPFVIDANQAFVQYETLAIFHSERERKFLAISGSTYSESRDGCASILAVNDMGNAPIAVLYFDETPDKHALVMNVPTKALSAYTLRPGNVVTSDVVAEFFPKAATLWEKRKVKTRTLADVNPMDSIVALEQQLDAVSALVVQHFDTLPAGQHPAWYQAFKDALTVNGTSALRSQSDNVTEFAAYKAGIRHLQTEYFLKRPTL
jgi:hypothetical protein